MQEPRKKTCTNPRCRAIFITDQRYSRCWECRDFGCKSPNEHYITNPNRTVKQGKRRDPWQ